MDEPFSDLYEESPVISPKEASPNDGKNKQPETLSDELFSIKISEEMAIRNALRTGLVEAQGKDTDKMPMFVSWPGWLDDGIVCMFSKDLHTLLDNAVKESAISFGKTFDAVGKVNAPAVAEQNISDSEFEEVSFPEIDKE